MDRKDGGPAFPRASSQIVQEGMTLRDYFAAKAMQAQLAAHVTEDRFFGHAERLAEVARVAYQQADAMIKVRSVS